MKQTISAIAPVKRVSFSAVLTALFCLLFSAAEVTPADARSQWKATEIGGPSQEDRASTGVLELGKATDREIAGGQSHAYRLTLTSGQYARVVVLQKAFDVVVKLMGPDGQLIFTVDNPNGSRGPETVHITAEATGIYRLEVSSYYENARPGRYEVQLFELRPATQQDRDRLTARRTFDEAERLRDQDTPDFDAALKKGEEALALYGAIGDRSEQYSVLLGIGSTYRMRREPQKALERLDQALEIARALGDKYRQARAFHNIGDIYGDTEERGRQLQSSLDALHAYQAVGEKTDEAEMLHGIGIVYNLLGEEEKAREYFERVLPLYHILEDKIGEARVLRRIGYSYHLEYDSQKALSYGLKALAIWQAIENKQEEAVERSLVGVEYARAGERQVALNNADEAARFVQTVEVSKPIKAQVLANVGQAYHKIGEFEKALGYHKEALQILQTLGAKRSEAILLRHTAACLRDLGRLAEAKANIEKSIALLEELRDRTGSPEQKASFLGSLFNFYELYGDLMMRLHSINPEAGHDLAALAFTEKVKARSLIELLAKARVDLGKGTDSARRTAITEAHPLVIKEIQQQLDSNTILLEYELGDERSYLWAVTVDGVLSYRLPPRAEVEAQARRVYQLLIARQPMPGLTQAQQLAREVAADAQYQAQATILSNMLLAPVSSKLGTKRLLIVADGALQYLPFAAMPVSTSPGVDPRPLILDHEIVSLPSASVLAVLRRELGDRKPATKPVAVLADPVFSPDDARVKQKLSATRPGRTQKPQTQSTVSSDSFSTLNRAIRSVRGEGEGAGLQRLLFSRDEAEAILSAVKPRQAGLEALDFRANRKMAMSDELRQYRIIHFSTHGLLDSRRPERSGLVLSLVDEDGQPQEGFLRLNEIYDLRLNADLVVLSACQTGLGRNVSGEGLIGLTRGFMYAGAPRVMASLWQVDDAATAELMKRVYRGVFQEQLPPAAALRAAQIEMLKKKQWQSPYFWAAFVLQGEWR